MSFSFRCYPSITDFLFKKVLNDNDVSLTCQVDSSTLVSWYLTKESKVIPPPRCSQCVVCDGLQTCSSSWQGTWSYLVVKVLGSVGRQSHSCNTSLYFVCVCQLSESSLYSVVRGWMCDAIAHLMRHPKCCDGCLVSTHFGTVCVFSVAENIVNYAVIGVINESTRGELVSDDWILGSFGPGLLEEASWFSGFSDAVLLFHAHAASWLDCLSSFDM